MKLTPRIEKAIQKAAILHDGQYRKGEGEPPYIIHPFSVVLLLANYTDDENTIVAGLLHDTIEDTDYTKEDMEQDFGKEVTEIVLGVTETKKEDGKALPWKVRKEEYIQKLKAAPEASLMVSAADKIHNLTSMTNECGKRGTDIWKIFKPGPDEQLWFYGEVLGVIKERLSNDIVSVFEKVYSEAKEVFKN